MNLRRRLDRLAQRVLRPQSGTLVIRRGVTNAGVVRAQVHAEDILIRRLDSNGVVHELLVPGNPDSSRAIGDWRPVPTVESSAEAPC